VTPTLNAEIIQILDGAVRLTLITFLILVACFSLYSFYTFNSRKLTGSRQADAPTRWQVLRPLFYSIVLSGLLSGVAFLGYALVPAPFLDNFTTAASWKRAPLRITALDSDRFHEGFLLNGEIWNQGKETLNDLQIVVSILDHNEEQLDELVVSTAPPDLESGQTASFELRYAEHSSLIHGYQLSFRSGDGTPINHVAGFNVE
jgi:hypothetical protein